MTRHWKGLVAFTMVALLSFVLAMMYDRYGIAIAVLLVALVLVSAYAIGVGRFRGRPDPPDEQRREHGDGSELTPRAGR